MSNPQYPDFGYPVFELESYRAKYLQENPPKRLSQQEHDSVYSKVPRFCVDALIYDAKQNSVVMVKRNIQPFKGFWHLPGVVVMRNELRKEAVKRCTKKETGLEVDVLKSIGIYDDPLIGKKIWTREYGWLVTDDPNNIINHIVEVFLTKPIGGCLQSDEENSEVRFFELSGLPEIIPFHHKDALDDFQAYLKTI